MAGMIRRRVRERWYGITGGKKDADGCALDFRPDAIETEEELTAVVLFADVDTDDLGAVLNRVDEWRQLDEHMERALGVHRGV